MAVYRVNNRNVKLAKPAERLGLSSNQVKRNFRRGLRAAQGRNVKVRDIPFGHALGQKLGFLKALLCKGIVFVVGVSVADKNKSHEAIL